MARIKGLVPCSVNFEVNKTAPIDSRTVIDTILELTQTNTWADDQGKVWLYDGLVVAVKENNGLYMLNGFNEDPLAYTDEANWHQIDASAAKIEVVNNLETDDATKALAASQGKALNDKIEALKTSLSAALNYKGSVDNFDSLPENPAKGDVYNVVAANGTIPAGTNYAWNGESWDALGGSVDLSGYYTKEEVDAAIEAATPTDELATIKADVKANKEALLVVNGDAETAGSLANTLKVSKEYTDTQLTGYVKKVEGSSLITSEKLALIDTNAADIAELEAKIDANTAAIAVNKTATETNAAALEVLNGDKDTEGSVLNIVNTQITNALNWQTIE